MKVGNQIELRKLRTGEQVRAIQVAGEPIGFGVFTPDSQRLVVSTQLSLRIQRIEEDDSELELPIGSNDVSHWSKDGPIFDRLPRSFAFSPDGKFMAVLKRVGDETIGGKCVLVLLDLSGALEPQELEDGLTDAFATPAFSQDGQFVAVSIHRNRDRPFLNVWDTATHTPVHKIETPVSRDFHGTPVPSGGFEYGARSLAFTPDGEGLLGFITPTHYGEHNQLFYSERESGKFSKSLISRDLGVTLLGGDAILRPLSGGKQVLVQGGGGMGSFAHLVDLTGPEPRIEQSFLEPPVLAHQESLLAVGNSLSGFGSLMAFIARPGDRPSERPSIQLCRLSDSKETLLCRLAPLFRGRLQPLAFAPNDRTLAVLCSYYVVDKHEVLYEAYDHVTIPMLRFLFAFDRRVHVYDIATGRRIARVSGREAVFSEDGKSLVTHGDGRVWVYAYPLHSPFLSILIWAMLPTACALLLRRRSRRAARVEGTTTTTTMTHSYP